MHACPEIRSRALRGRRLDCPRVAFENGKAKSAWLNWGEANAPMLAYALIYAGTGFDNSTKCWGRRWCAW